MQDMTNPSHDASMNQRPLSSLGPLVTMMTSLFRRSYQTIRLLPNQILPGGGIQETKLVKSQFRFCFGAPNSHGVRMQNSWLRALAPGIYRSSYQSTSPTYSGDASHLFAKCIVFRGGYPLNLII
jgi:hypothetical protein